MFNDDHGVFSINLFDIDRQAIQKALPKEEVNQNFANVYRWFQRENASTSQMSILFGYIM